MNSESKHASSVHEERIEPFLTEEKNDRSGSEAPAPDPAVAMQAVSAKDVREADSISRPSDPVSEPTFRSFGTASVLTTAFVSACLSVAAAIAYMHFFPPEPRRMLPPVMAADMLKVSQAVAAMSGGDINEAERLFRLGAQTMQRLRDAGVVVIDAKSVLSAPAAALLQPSDLIPDAPELESSVGPSRQPDLFDGKDPVGSIRDAEKLAPMKKPAGAERS